MDYSRREEIFSKEVLSIEDIMELCGLRYDTAARMIRNMKRKSDRLNMEGKIHILDYFIAMEIDPKEPGVRYSKLKELGGEEKASSPKTRMNRSVCI